MFKARMKKRFIVAGELSGDKLGAWFLKKSGPNKDEIICQAVGGDFLKNAGAQVYERIEKLNITGIVEIIKHLKFIFKFLNSLANYICSEQFDEVVLVDFPGFNLRLAKKLKQKNSNIKITYLSPPQLWVWGQWRIRTLKKYCDKVIVLYPFEVDWYKQRGVEAQFLGNPVYDNVNQYFEKIESKENELVILPGSRNSEIEKLLPIFVDAIKRFKSVWPEVEIVLPLAESINVKTIQQKLKNLDAPAVTIVQGEQEKLKVLSSACMAICKPGTVTLELALLKIPALIIYKTSWLTYWLARLVVKVKYMSLPNLLLKKQVFKELIQKDCSSQLIFENATRLYKSCISKDENFQKLQKDFCNLRQLFN